MSQEDNEKNFLSRWSQRKHEAKQPDADSAAVKPAEDVEASTAPMPESAAEEQFDLSSLPKLEDITETTDITGFLRKGVPESLRNAALRKSWALDPAIRNYVNPALDYAYDWNTPGGVPGNSELAAGTDIAKMVLQIMGRDSAAHGPEEPNAFSQSDAAGVSGDPSIDAPQNSPLDLPLEPVRLSAPSTPAAADHEVTEHVEVENTQNAELKQSGASQQEVRRHGTAKPRV